MAFDVVLTTNAYRDLDEILQWADENNIPDLGRILFRAVIKASYTLTTMPARCPVVHQSTRLGKEIRMLLSGQKNRVFRIYFLVRGNTVNVLHLRHWARKPLTTADLVDLEIP